MPSFHRTQTLKVESQPIFSEVNAASADVWNQCLYQMDMYQWHRGYPHAHDHFYFGKDCAGWIDKKLSNSILHSQSRQAVRERYFKSWKSYTETLKKSGGVEKPTPPQQTKKLHDDTLEKVCYPICRRQLVW